MSTPNQLIHDYCIYWLGSGTSMKRGLLKLVLCANIEKY